MKNILILLLLFLMVNVSPQNRNDSLLLLLEKVSDTSRIGILKDLCWENRYSNPAEAMRYGLEALALVKQLEQDELAANIYNYLGIIQRNIGDHASALEYFFNAQQIAEEQQLAADLAYSYNNIGDIYNLEENYHKALQYELRALNIFEGLGDSLGVSYCCHQIALVYNNLEDFTSALKYDTRAMNLRELAGNKAGVAYSWMSIGQTYLKLDNKVESLESLNKSSHIFTELKDSFGLSLCFHNIGLYYKLSGEIDSATIYFNEALKIGQETDSPIRIRNATQELSDLYAGQNRFKEAYQMYTLYKETYDSLYHEENLVKITQMVMRNEYDQRELLQLAKIERQKQFRNYLILSFGLILILVVVIFNRYYIKRKANIGLQQKNKEIENQRDKLEGLFGSLRIKNDELNRTLNDLTQAQMQLVQSEKMASLGQLTAGVAHELNNPLNFITSSINPLQRNIEDLLHLLSEYDSIVENKNLTEEFSEVIKVKEDLEYTFLVNETKDLLKGVTEGASRSEHIIKDLRTFSRMDENEFKSFNIHEGIESTLLLLNNKMKDRITIHRNFGNIQHVECLPGRLNQVFMNILNNSILAIENKGDIFVETSGFEDMARISIRDNGKGMPKEVLDHIFEPFYTTRVVGEGTGLGLSISYSIIEEHHGTIEVLSDPGLGSEFIITLPFIKKE
jgi:signal transduction histidine kinase